MSLPVSGPMVHCRGCVVRLMADPGRGVRSLPGGVWSVPGGVGTILKGAWSVLG